MPFRKSSSMDAMGLGRVAQGWGKVVARRVEEQVGPELDLDADDIEHFAKQAACALAQSTFEKLPCRSPVCAPPGVAQAAFFRLIGILQAGTLCFALQVGSSPLRRAASSTANETTPASVHSIL